MSMTVNVDPAQVSSAGTTVKSAASGVSGAAGSLTAAGVTATGFTTAETLAEFCRAWSATLTTFASTCTSSGGALVHDATTYKVQESSIVGKLREIER